MFQDGKIGGALAVDVDDATLLGVAVCDFGHVPQQYGRSADDLDGNAGKLRDGFWAGVELYGVVGVADASVARGQNYIRVLQRGDDVSRGQSLGRECLRINVDDDLAF